MKRQRDEAGQYAGEYVLGGLLFVGGIALVAWVIMFIGGWGSTPVNKVGLHYTGGPIDGNKFDGVLEPGSGAKFLGLLDHLHTIPVNQRNYIISKAVNEGDREGADQIVVPAKGGVDFSFEAAVYFKINTATDNIKSGRFKHGGTARQFYETFCTKPGYSCDDNSKGWDRMLNDLIRNPLEAAMRQKVFDYTPDELFANRIGTASGDQDAILKIQKDIATSLKDIINNALGGDFFCGPTFDRNQPNVCPDIQFIIKSATPTDDGVRTSYAEQQASQNRIVTAENNAQAKKAEAEGNRLAAEAGKAAYGDPNYLDYLRAQAMADCAKNTNCTLVITNGGSGTNVNVGSKPGG